MNIGLDMMGGDFAPLEAVKGVKLYLEQLTVNGYQLSEKNNYDKKHSHRPG